MARNKYPEETVKLILDVATHLFVEKGYDATSLQDIINETKLSKGAKSLTPISNGGLILTPPG